MRPNSRHPHQVALGPFQHTRMQDWPSGMTYIVIQYLYLHLFGPLRPLHHSQKEIVRHSMLDLGFASGKLESQNAE